VAQPNGLRHFCYLWDLNSPLRKQSGGLFLGRGRVPLPAPKLDTSFDTMSIEAGVQFLFAKTPIYKGFPILFNDNRLYGGSEMVTVEPFLFYPSIPFNERSVGCAF